MIRVIAGPLIVNSHWLCGEICTNNMLSNTRRGKGQSCFSNISFGNGTLPRSSSRAEI